MQAAWGAENKAPTPIRTGELYGEQGRWLVNNTETVPEVFTRAVSAKRFQSCCATHDSEVPITW